MMKKEISPSELELAPSMRASGILTTWLWAYKNFEAPTGMDYIMKDLKEF